MDDGANDGTDVGTRDGTEETEGTELALLVGSIDGWSDGTNDGTDVGTSEGADDGLVDGDSDGVNVGTDDGAEENDGEELAMSVGPEDGCIEGTLGGRNDGVKDGRDVGSEDGVEQKSPCRTTSPSKSRTRDASRLPSCSYSTTKLTHDGCAELEPEPEVNMLRSRLSSNCLCLRVDDSLKGIIPQS